jgi:hypothetical protein
MASIASSRQGAQRLSAGSPGRSGHRGGKQRRIARAAQEYLLRRRLPSSTRCRFDVVSVLDSGGMPEVTILRGAFAMPEARGSRA